MINDETLAQYAGYSDEELRDFLGRGIPDWQRELFQRILQLRAEKPSDTLTRSAVEPNGDTQHLLFGSIFPVCLLALGALLLILSFTVLPFIFSFGALGLVAASVSFKWNHRKNRVPESFDLLCHRAFLGGAALMVPLLALCMLLLCSGIRHNRFFPPTVETIRYGSLGSGLNVWKSLKSQWDVLGDLSIVSTVPAGLTSTEKALFREFREIRDVEMVASVWRRKRLAEVQSAKDFASALDAALYNQQVVDQRFIAFFSSLEGYVKSGGQAVSRLVTEEFRSQDVEEERSRVVAEQALMRNLISQFGALPDVTRVLSQYQNYLVARLPKAEAKTPTALEQKLSDFGEQISAGNPYIGSMFNNLPPEAFASSASQDNYWKASSPEMEAAIQKAFPMEPDYSLFGHEPPPR